MSADLLEAFGSDAQSNIHETPNFSGLNNVDRTGSILTEYDSTEISQPTHVRETNLEQKDSSYSACPRPEHSDNVLFDADIYEAADAAQIENDDDEFGDFAEADDESTPASDLTSARITTQTSSLIDLDDHETSLASHSQPTISSRSPSKSTVHTFMPRMSHLTLTERAALHTKPLVEAEDEWGQFEDVDSTDEGPAVQKNKQKSMDPQSESRSTEPLVASNNGQKSKSTESANSDREATGDDGFDDGWKRFDEEVPEVPAACAAQSKGSAQEPLNASTRSQEVRADRPTNVPPPAILLGLFPKVFSLLYAQAEQTQNDVTGAQVLEAYRACARIMTCRQLRWKRDTILAQSMRIGAAGRSGGMKLTSLDRGETRREEQEAQEAISSWSRSSHKLNAAMVKARIAKPPASLSTSLTVRVASGVDVLTSNHICPLCGLKRNERISGIDVDVADIFGEFWIEHWGHKDCHEIWYTYKHLLDQR